LLRGLALSKPATAPARSFAANIVGRLAKFFPQATPVRIPVELTTASGKSEPLTESTVIEYGTPREVLFATRIPLEFADKLRVQNSDGSLDTEVSVVAVQYHNGETAVAARFTQEVANWIVKP
jgi:hypothetical protein